MISRIQHFEADFLSIKILNLGIILKTFTYAINPQQQNNRLRTDGSLSLRGGWVGGGGLNAF